MAKRRRKATSMQAKSRTKRAAVKHVRRREISVLEKNILWCFALGSRNASNVASSLDLTEGRAEEEVSRLSDSGFLMDKGGFLGGYELTAQGYEALGNPGIKLDSRITAESLKSGAHAKLIITAKNTGSAPVTDAVVRIVAPKFLTISRYNAEYERDDETAVIQFPLTHLNPGENQTIEFNLQGKLTSGTTQSKYKVLVQAMTGGSVTDKKELGITLVA